MAETESYAALLRWIASPGRWPYGPEKRAHLERLAALLDRITPGWVASVDYAITEQGVLDVLGALAAGPQGEVHTERRGPECIASPDGRHHGDRASAHPWWCIWCSGEIGVPVPLPPQGEVGRDA